jgi:hypothetical protein
MSFDLEIQRLATRTATLLVIPSWGGFIYTFFHRPHRISFPVSASLPEVGFVTIATLLCSLITLLCALPTLSDDISSLSGWLFVVVCALPFLGMIGLLDPAGITPTY